MKKIGLILILFLLPAFVWAQAGSTGLIVLKSGMGGKSAALGDAVVAANNGALSTYWNPAGLTSAENEIVFGHSEYIQDVSYEFIAIKFDGYNANWGLSLHVQNVDNIAHRTQATPEPLSTFSEHEVVAGLSYARMLSPNLAFGTTIKYITERHFSYTSKGAALDLGFNYLALIKNLDLGLSFHNLGSISELREEATKLPALLRAGAFYKLDKEMAQSNLGLFATYTKIFENDGYAGLGVEAITRDILALRLGYQLGRDSQDISAGVGLKIQRYQLDYAYVPFSYDLGDTHRLSFSLSL